MSTYKALTDFPESAGTLQWDSTTLVLVRASGRGKTGHGADTATARLVQDLLSRVVTGCNVMATGACWQAMVRQTRNPGRPGMVSMAKSVVDSALWDLKARVLQLPLVTLLGAVRESVPVYGSGGFTSYSEKQLQGQLAGWVEQGISRVKIKIGRDGQADQGCVGKVKFSLA